MKLHKEDLHRLVDAPYFQRGQQYCNEKVVKFTSIGKTKVSARVVGAAVYKVMLWYKANELDGTCTCVAFMERGPCKHIAAVGLALLLHNTVGYATSEEYADEIEGAEEFERSLSKKSKQELIEMLIEIAQQFPEALEELGYMESSY